MTRRDDQTFDMFEVPQPVAPLPASMDYRAQVAALVAEMLKAADKAGEGDRIEIAARMTRIAGIDVSKYMLDAYASEGRETFNVPLWLIPALESACGSHDLTNWLVGVRGGRLLIGKEALTAELGRLERMRDQAGQRIRELKKRMGEGE